MTARRLKGHWWIDFSFKESDGRRQRRRERSPVDTKKGAEEFERQRRADLAKPAHERKKTEVKPTLEKFSEEFINSYAMANNKPSEVEAKRSTFRSWLVPELGRRRLDEIGVRDIEALKAKMVAAELTPSRINNVLTCLNRMLKYATEIELLEYAPRVRFVKKGVQDFDFLDFAEYRRLVEAAKQEPALHAAILAAGDAGLRAGEIRALKWSRIDYVARQLTVAETFWRKKIGSPKGGRIGKLPMTEALTIALRSLRHLRGEFVFCHDDGEAWTRDWADAALRRQCRRAGLREISWHVLRHTFCSHLAMQGAPAKAIQELARHTSLGVTQRYMHLCPDHRRDAIDLLDARPDGHQLGTGVEKTNAS
jgi:integrase